MPYEVLQAASFAPLTTINGRSLQNGYIESFNGKLRDERPRVHSGHPWGNMVAPHMVDDVYSRSIALERQAFEEGDVRKLLERHETIWTLSSLSGTALGSSLSSGTGT